MFSKLKKILFQFLLKLLSEKEMVDLLLDLALQLSKLTKTELDNELVAIVKDYIARKPKEMKK